MAHANLCQRVEDCAMPLYEKLYLALVLTAFLAFTVSLAAVMVAEAKHKKK